MSDRLGCEEVQDLIEAVAAAAVTGESLVERRALVMAHMRTCPRCRASYLFLLDALQLQKEAEARLAAAGDPIPLRFNCVEEEGWWRRLGDRHPEVFPLGFQISGGHIREALRAWKIGGSRDVQPKDAGEGAVFFSEWFGTDRGTMTARLTGRPRVSDPERVDLYATLSSKESLPAGLHVSVLWGSEFQAAPLDPEGTGRLEDFRLEGALEAEEEEFGPDLIMTFGMVREDATHEA